MSSQPPQPPPDDDFPKPGEGTETISYMVGTRFSGGPVTGRSVPGHLVGELITRVSKLYSALRDGGSNLSRAVDSYPFAFRASAFRASVDIFLELPGTTEETTEMFPTEGIDPAAEALDKLQALVAASPSEVAATAAEFGGAVATAYRQLASLLGQRGVAAAFFAADGFEARETSFVRLNAPRAFAQAEALSDRDVLRIETVRLVGLLDELASGRGVFKLVWPPSMSPQHEVAWRDAVGRARSIEGQLTDEAAIDIRRLNAWSSLVEVELLVTHMNAPTSTRAEEVDAELLRLISVQPELDAE